MGAARMATPIIRRSPPAWRTDVDVAEEHAPGALVIRQLFEVNDRDLPSG
jgi:hypothetical protein